MIPEFVALLRSSRDFSRRGLQFHGKRAVATVQMPPPTVRIATRFFEEAVLVTDGARV